MIEFTESMIFGNLRVSVANHDPDFDLAKGSPKYGKESMTCLVSEISSGESSAPSNIAESTLAERGTPSFELATFPPTEAI
jgi:hypothetical protein